MKTFLMASFLTEFGGQLFFFTLPLLAIQYGANFAQLGILGGIGSLFYIPFSIFFSTLSGKKHLKKINFPLVSSAITGLFIILTFFFRNIQFLYIIAACTTISLAGLWPPLMLKINEKTEKGKSGSVVGKFSTAWSAGTTLGPIIAGILYQKYVFLPVICSAVIFFLTSQFFLSFTKDAQEEKVSQDTREIKKHPDIKTLLFAYIGIFAVYFSFGAVRNLFPRLATDIGLKPSRIGLLFSLMDFFRTGTFFLFSKKVSAYNIPLFFVIYGVLAYFSLTGIIFTNSSLLFAVNFALLGGCLCGIYYAYGLYTVFTITKGYTVTVGLFEAIIGIGVSTGSFLGGFCTRWLGERSPYIVSLITGIIISIVQILMITKRTTGSTLDS
ncbi:MAG: Multidrug resistance protein MdtG [candidate division TA06 bacterium ADurb.Bin131]|uniref:Multidrug resistance protein MdtG n=1 Tax=candidate division TA06 bacterium ADurb.Bin131 TaxID=1852827 RepID=A0A1V6C4H0_UNCT6|nr:MAG: Multidrug resistance protein MdtG [candidate division TA06 bacterium ADurb.Bin131]